jgi:hypothetical protein
MGCSAPCSSKRRRSLALQKIGGQKTFVLVLKRDPNHALALDFLEELQKMNYN